jgi:phosphinothricin acetyltransferase
MIIRAATEHDADALAAIYGHAVLHGFGTFEEEPPSPADMEGRRRLIANRGLPYLAAEEDGHVLGFAYAGPFRPRAAYRYTLEDCV